MKKQYVLFLSAGILLLFGLVGCINPGSKGRSSYDDHRVKRLFDAQFAKIYLRDVGGLVYRQVDSVIWAPDGDQQMGLFGVWFLQGEKFNLSDPNIQVAYFAKSIPGQESMEKILSWVEKTFISEKGGKILLARTEVPTYSGKSGQMITIQLPPDLAMNEMDRGKWLSYTYIEQEKYFIAFVLTAFDEIRFERIYKFYKDLAGTYEES